MSLSPELRSQRGRIAALVRWSQEDPQSGTQAARDGFHQRFLDAVDPDGTLPPAERERRAQAALKAHMAQLAFKSAKARARSKDGPK
jgi:hypothetical protein